MESPEPGPATTRRSHIPLDQVDTKTNPFPLAPMYSLTLPSAMSARNVPPQFPQSPIDGRPPPPSYDAASIIPEDPVVYSFSFLETSSSAMLLTPLLDYSRTQSSYHISVGHDPFIPTHLVTSVARGSNEQGLYVGGFKKLIDIFRTVISSPNHPHQPVYINGGEYKLLDIFQKRKIRKGALRFAWGNKQIVNLRWTCPHWPSSGKFTCHAPSDKARIFAEFYVTETIGNRPRAEPQLTVMPIGHRVLDDIVVSLLLLERQRLSTVLGSCEHSVSRPLLDSQDRKAIQEDSD